MMIAEGPGAPSAPSLPEGSPPALAIEQEGDWIEVRISDAAASEAQMESELRAAGIDADISLAPAWLRGSAGDRRRPGARAGRAAQAHAEVCGDARVVR